MKLVPFFIAFILLASCTSDMAQDVPDNYPKDFNISSPSGRPWDSLEYYVPTTVRKDSHVVKLDIPLYHLEYFSAGLYYAQEPILYNYYTGHDIYRFSLLRAFNAPIYFILHRDGDKVWLVTKGLDKRPNTGPPATVFVRKGNIGHWENVTKDENGDTIIYNARGSYIRRAHVLYNGYVQLTRQDWAEFEGLLKEYDFWNLQPYNKECLYEVDGQTWLIESHRRNKYWFVHSCRPQGAFNQAGEFLIQKSGVEDLPIFKQKP
ncbi:MAG: hypothetical protein U0264_05540 [Candidatus Kapaibacterium sp.]